MRVKCNNCGKEYDIKDEFLTGGTLRMKCRGCGEIIVIEKKEQKTKEGVSSKGEESFGSQLIDDKTKDKSLLPQIKREISGIDEFELAPPQSSVPPPKGKATIVAGSVPPPAPVTKKEAIDDPFSDILSLEKEDISSVAKGKRKDILDVPAPKKESKVEDAFAFKSDELKPKLVTSRSNVPDLLSSDFFPSDAGSQSESGFADLPVPSKPRSYEDFSVKDVEMNNLGRNQELKEAQAKREFSSKTPLQIPAVDEKFMRSPTPLPPVLAQSVDLPSLKDSTSKELDEPFASIDLPARKSEIDLPAKKSDGVNVPLSPSPIPQDFQMEVDLPVKKEPGKVAGLEKGVEGTKIQRGEAGGTSYGELDLGEEPEIPTGKADQEDIALPARKHHAMPSETGGEASSVEIAIDERGIKARRVSGVEKAETLTKQALAKEGKRVKWVKPLIYLLIIIVLGIAGFTGWKKEAHIAAYKIFSKYILGRDIDAYYAERDKLISEVSSSLKEDSYKSYIDGIKKLENFMKNSSDDGLIAAYISYLCSITQIRFGKDKKLDKLGEDLLGRVPPENSFPSIYLISTSSQKILRGTESMKVLSYLVEEQKKNPNDRDLAVLVALGFLNNKNGQEAYDAYSKLAGLEGNWKRSRFGMIRALFLMGDQKRGDEMLNKFMEDFPDFIEARILKARRYFDMGSTEQSQALIDTIDLEKEKISNPFIEIPVKSLKGMIELRNERDYKAKIIFEDILKTDPTNIDALLGMAEIDLIERNPVRASGRYNLVLGVEPKNSNALFGMIQSQIDLSNFQEVKALLAKMETEYKDDYRLYYYKAKLAVALGENLEAENNYRISIEKKPEALAHYIGLSELYLKQGRGMEGLGILEEAAKKRPVTAGLLVATAKMYMELGEMEKAIDKLKEALKKDDSNMNARFNLGVALYKMKDYESSLKQFEEVAKFNPHYPDLSLYRGLLYEAKGDNEKAMEFYNEAIKVNPDDENVLLRAIEIFVASENFDRAEPLVSKVMGKNPGNSDAVYYMGRILLGQGKLVDALNYFEKAIKLNPHKGLYHLWAGITCDNIGNFPAALQYSEKAIELDPSLAKAYYLSGKIKVKMKLIRDGKEDLKKALELDSGIIDVWGPLGIALEEERNFKEAIIAYSKYLAKNINDYEIHCRMAMLLYERGDINEAKEHFQKCVDISRKSAPDSKWRFTALYYLGKIEENSGNINGAIKYYEEYLRGAPQSAIDREDVQKHLENLSKKQ